MSLLSARRLLAALAFALPVAAVQAQADPPARIARLSHSEGSVVFSHAGDKEWAELAPSRPVTRGDRLWTDGGARAELQLGATTIRLGSETLLDVKQLDGQAADLGVARGSLSARLRSLSDGDSFEIDTPNLAFRATEPGHYRVDVDPANGITRVTVLTGAGAAYGASGQTVVLAGGQQASFREKDLTRVSSHEAPPLDNFDRWADERNRREDQSVAARYVPRDITGYQQLDPHGQWAQDATLGAIWYPQVDAKWAPYRFGQWEWIAPWGWTWLDDAPWAFATSHYGRWSRIDSRWAWVPGRLAAKPVYAPALVAFVGKGDSLAWFPLAPGEAWQTPYKASLTHSGGINRGALAATAERGPLAHQRSVHALTVIASGDFQRGRPAQASWLRLALNELSSAQVVPPPPMPQHTTVASLRPQPAAPARPAPPAPATVAAPVAAPAARPVQLAQAPVVVQQPVIRPAKPVAPPVAAAPKTIQPVPPRPAPRLDAAEAARAQAAQLAQRREQAARDAREHSARAQALRDKALRLETARRAEQTQKAQLARRAEQTRRTSLAKREADAKRVASAQADVRVRQVAMAQVQAQAQAQKQAQVKREKQLRRVALAHREEQARKEDLARQEARSQWLAQTRRSADREAHSLREQQAQREERDQREAVAKREASDGDRGRRDAQEREQARFDAWQRQQQAQSDKLRRDQQLWEQARERTRQPPAQDRRYLPPEWQRIPVVPSRVL